MALPARHNAQFAVSLHGRERRLKFELTDLDDGNTLIKLHMRLDAPGVARIESLLLTAVAGSRARVLLDLGAVDFVASMGVHLLVSAARAAQSHGAHLVLFGAQPMVARVFEQTALARAVAIAADLEAAKLQRPATISGRH